MDENIISNLLIEHGEELFNAPKQPVRFTNDHDIDELLNDLDSTSHAFVLACIMDRQIKAERAWAIPLRISEKIDGFSMEILTKLTQDEIKQLMTEPEPLHRFVNKMSECFFYAINHINTQYNNIASNIWSGNISSAEVIYRFLQFKGIGPKIATMATNILARDFKIRFSDYTAIDISADVHIKRVFTRLGLCSNKPSAEQVIFKAKALHPEFPGIMDAPCWEIGRMWCKANNPDCNNCYMKNVCKTANKQLRID